MTRRFQGFGLQGGPLQLFFVAFIVTALGLALAFGTGFRTGQPWLFVALLYVPLAAILILASATWAAYRTIRATLRSDVAQRTHSWNTVLLPIAFFVMVAATHIWVTRPELYRTCTSPDDGLVLKVYRAMSPPYAEGVDVIVTVEDAKGRRLYRRVIDNRDLWGGVEHRYPNVLCERDRFVVGPHWWNGERSTDFILAKSELASK